MCSSLVCLSVLPFLSGALVCDACSKHEQILPKIDPEKPVRVCNQCQGKPFTSTDQSPHNTNEHLTATYTFVGSFHSHDHLPRGKVALCISTSLSLIHRFSLSLSSVCSLLTSRCVFCFQRRRKRRLLSRVGRNRWSQNWPQRQAHVSARDRNNRFTHTSLQTNCSLDVIFINKFIDQSIGLHNCTTTEAASRLSKYWECLMHTSWQCVCAISYCVMLAFGELVP